MTKTISATKHDIRLAWLTALAITIHVAEALLPSPLPGVKPGMANLVVIMVMLQFGWKDAAWVSLLRVLAGSLLLGTFLTPTFLLSLAGALSSLAMLWLSQWLPGRGFSALGLSLLAALAHMLGQFSLAYLLFIPHPGLLVLLPVLLTMAAIFGVFNGIILLMARERLQLSP
jgi:heptaprenyl diphosphate synthase